VRAQLAGLTLADAPEDWRALGFTVDDAREVSLGGVTLTLGDSAAPARGITRWTLRHAPELDHVPTAITARPPAAPVEHPNGALSVDHVVIVTPDFDGSAAVLAAHGLELRRTRQAGDRRQGFRRLGPAIMELVEAPEAPAVAFWGLTIVVCDLVALARTHTEVSDPRPAVQPGRQIATVDRSAGLSTRLAFMDPE
jgi:hypothetical protein